MQWRVVRQVETIMGVWKNVLPVTAADMGRIAGKIESVEGALDRLAQFEVSAFSSLSDSFESKFCSGNSRQPRRNGLIPGLQRVSAGAICGALHVDPSMVAKKIESDRLEFRGEPAFEPSPYLDARSRSIFEHPIQNALKPEESPVEPPAVKIHCSQREKDKLLEKLDQCGRLGMVAEAEVLTGYQAGLFAVNKDLEKDRLIFDSRPFNLLERPPGRWVKAMASCGPLLDLQLRPDEKCLTSGTDLRDFYYGFKISPERLRRNSLVGPVKASSYKHLRCYRSELKDSPRVYFCLNTLAMGDSQAVEIAQTALFGILVQAGLVEPSSLLAMDLSLSRMPLFTGVVIDDLIVFERIVCNQQLFKGEFRSQGAACLDRALDEYRKVGLLPHPKKTFRNESSSEFWGCQFDGELGLIQANTKRVIPIMAVTAKVLQLGLCSIGLLEVLVGSWTSIFLFRRRLLCLLNLVYQPCQGDVDRKHILRLSPELKEELLLCMCLSVTAVTNLRVANSEYLYCSDASEWGIAITRAKLPSWLQSEIHRHKLKKSVWVKLLSPLRALERLRGTLPPAEELPDGCVLASHPLWIELGSCLRFEEVMRKHIAGNRHINILELRGMIRTEAEVAKEKFPCRFFSLADSQVSLGTWIKGRSSSFGLNQELQQSLPLHIGCGLYSNAGFLPTELNTADDPTRGKSARSPAKCPESWLYDPGENLQVFDAWLESYNVTPYSTSGLPPLSELFGDSLPVREPTHLAQKSKLHFSKVKVDKKNKLKTAAEPDKAFRKPSKESSCKSSTFVESAKLPVLSPEGKALVDSIPSEQFVLPRKWRPCRSWRPSRCGALDLYSGAKGVARELAERGHLWVITFEIEDGANQDILSPENQQLIEKLLLLKCVIILGVAIFCCSFSRAVRPPIRTRESPLGIKGLNPTMQNRVEIGNRHALFVAGLITVCRKLKIHYWLENPDGSFLWLLDCFIRLGSQDRQQLFRIDYCMLGCAWRKRTRVLTSCHLGGQHLWCDRSHQHIRLVGWSKCHKQNWTRVAQTYPKKLCELISKALLLDCGLLPGQRHVNLASICRCKNCRIGEASNPGPRPKKRADKRELDELDQMQLVESSTLKLGSNIWKAFLHWVSCNFSNEEAASLTGCFETLGVLISLFGRHLYESRQSLYLLRQLITHVQREAPSSKGKLHAAWQLVSKWERLEPVTHRTPLPYALYKALVSLALTWKWFRVAGIIVLTFECICRPGEVLRATREDLLLPSDLLAEDPSRVFLRIRSPKARFRGLGLVQHASMSSRPLAEFLERIFGGLQKQDSLFAGSPASFRRRWDKLLSALQVSPQLGLTPASMRGGSAVFHYRTDGDVSRLLWKMRLKHLETLQHYLQEVGADSVMPQLSLQSRSQILAAGSLFEILISTT